MDVLLRFSCVCFLLLAATATTLPDAEVKHGKLLYILMDGFRYDYLNDFTAEEIPGFTEFFKNGVKAEWMNPIYPTKSYPSWTTLVTGLYAESHNIVGNYFYDPEEKDYFSIFDANSTGNPKWWIAEPIWTTATKANLQVALYLWSRCDVPFDSVLPNTCEPFIKIPGIDIFKTNIDKALENLEAGYDLVQVYTEYIDNIGHTFGPETEAIKQGIRELDGVMVYLQEKLRELNLENEVNIVVVSDHGMTEMRLEEVERYELDDFLPEGAVESIADWGSLCYIKVLPGRLEEVYTSLSNISGAVVYKHDEIPESFHLKNSQYIPDIMVLVNMGSSLLGSRSPEQMPPVSDYDKPFSCGAHGYDAQEQQMRGIFFAKGPAFKDDLVIKSVNLVDIYQVLMHVLGVEALPHNGTWDNVAPALENGALGRLPCDGVTLVLAASVVALANLLA